MSLWGVVLVTTNLLHEGTTLAGLPEVHVDMSEAKQYRVSAVKNARTLLMSKLVKLMM